MSTSAWLVLAWWTPWLAALAIFARPQLQWLMPLAALPALSAAIWATGAGPMKLEWLLLGSTLGLDSISRVFLLGASVVWALAGVHALAHRRKATQPSGRALPVSFLLAMGGNLGVILSQDAVTFFTAYAVMGLAGYGLIRESAHPRADEAARRYLRWTIAGELLLFSAVTLWAASLGTIAIALPDSHAASGWPGVLFILAFGIKLALPGLHFWMPLAYATASPAAAAVLSGAMINAGILGLLKFLPATVAAHAELATLLVAAGVAGAAFGWIRGMLSRDDGQVLAYSSISQMGFIATALGLGLWWPHWWPGIAAAIALYALHHGWVKAALFLSRGVPPRLPKALTFAVVIWLVLALAGAPWTSGFAAKDALLQALAPAGDTWSYWFALSSVFTAGLMVRFLQLRQGVSTQPGGRASGVAWLALTALIAILPWLLPAAEGGVMKSIFTIAAGVLLAWMLTPFLRGAGGRDHAPASTVSSAVEKARRGWPISPACPPWIAARFTTRTRQLREGRDVLASWHAAGALWFALLVVFMLLPLFNR